MHDSETVVDLTNPIDRDIPSWPSAPTVDLETTAWAARDGVRMERVEMATHTATHVDAPAHFLPEGKRLDEYPLEKFMGRGVVLDLSGKEAGEGITVADLDTFEAAIEPDDVVMLHTGWDDHYGLTPEYLFEWPYLTGEAAEYLASLEPKAVGTEGLSVGGWTGDTPVHGPTTDVDGAASHRPLLRADALPIEEVRNLGRVLDGDRTARAQFFYPPLRFRGTGGSPVRCFALL